MTSPSLKPGSSRFSALLRLSAVGIALGLFLFTVAITAFHVRTTTVRTQGADNTVTLPILVYPDDGQSTHIERVTVHASDVSAVDSLYFQMHQPFYHLGGAKTDETEGFDLEGAASIRVNDGPWVDIRNENVDCATPEGRSWCVGGTFSTIRFTLPATASGSLADGANTIDFRFNGTDGIRSGYRVLGMGLMTPSDPHARDFDTYPGAANGDGVQDGAIDQTTFDEEDPSTWQAPSNGNASNGKQLWSQRNLLVDGFGASLTASCADCHFKGGEDLKYFNFSNRSITARSRFHGLSEQQGKDIAAYIRSISLQTESGGTYEAPGTPWAPPFQPGPEMLGSNQHPDEGDPAYWMAGAGLRWVLDSEREVPNTERDMLAHIFPENGDPSQGVAYLPNGDLKWTHIHADSTLNLRSLPINSQFPDWNSWLPDIHPLDFQPNLQSTEGWNYIQNDFPSVFESGTIKDVFQAVSTFRQYTGQDYGWPKGIDASSMIGSPTTNEVGLARLSSQQFRTVALLDEAFTHHRFDDAGKWNCGANGIDWNSWCEELSLPGGTETLFRLGPHVNGTFENVPYGYGTREKSGKMTHLWYHLQVVMDPNAKVPNSVDWNYQNAFMPGGDDGRALRDLSNYVIQVQIFSNELGNAPSESTKLNFSWSYGGPKLDFFFDGFTSDPNYGGLNSDTHGKIVEAFMRSWWQHTDTYDPSTFLRDDASDVRKYDNESYGPHPGEYAPPFEYRTRYYNAYHNMAQLHGNEMAGVLDSLTTWGGTMWPKGNDSSFMGSHPTWEEIIDYTPSQTTSQNITLAAGWNLISSRLAPSDGSMDALFSDVETDLAIVQNQQGDAYDPTSSSNSLDTWDDSQGYRVYMTSDQTVTIDGTALGSPSLSLSEGWNLIPYYPPGEMPVEDAFASISDKVAIVKDQAGNSYIPARDLDEIGTMKPGEAYKVYVNTSTSFSYP